MQAISKSATIAPDYCAVISTPIGMLGIKTQHTRYLAKIDFLFHNSRNYSVKPLNNFTYGITQQLNSYFIDPTSNFDIKFQLQGTPFQQRVWEALTQIPCGETWTYGELAKRLHTSPRAIGNACRANPIPVIIPCHRIIAATHLGGYAGETQIDSPLYSIKKWLITHETSFPHR